MKRTLQESKTLFVLLKRKWCTNPPWRQLIASPYKVGFSPEIWTLPTNSLRYTVKDLSLDLKIFSQISGYCYPLSPNNYEWLNGNFDTVLWFYRSTTEVLPSGQEQALRYGRKPSDQRSQTREAPFATHYWTVKVKCFPIVSQIYFWISLCLMSQRSIKHL